jgi:hypothetical protein
VAVPVGVPRVPLPSPAQLLPQAHTQLPSMENIRALQFRGGIRGLSAPNWLGVMTLAAMLAPLGFLLLPTTRCAARVRPVHLARIALYSLVIIMLSVLYMHTRMGLLAAGPLPWGLNRISEINLQNRWLAGAGVPLLLVIWWSFASIRYLKVPHGLLTGLCMVLLGGLSSLLILSLIITLITTYE